MDNIVCNENDILKSHEKNYPLIDIAKLVCALLVVLIHCLEIKEGHPIATFIVYCFSGQAVPFFLIVSGFFASKKILQYENIFDTFKFCLKSWILVYLVWSILWLPYFINIYQERYIDVSMAYFIFILIRRFFLAGQGVYWYLLVLAEAVFVVAVFVKLKREKLLYFISFIGLLLGILYDANITALGMDNVNRIFYTIFSWSNNVIMKGIPYVSIGYFFYKNSSKLRFNLSFVAILYILASAIMTLLYFLGNTNYICLVSVQAVCLFIFTIQDVNVKLNNSFITACRNISSSLYFLHTVFIYGVIDIIWGVDAMILLKFTLAVIFSFMVYLISVKTNNKHLKWLLGIKI